MTNTGATMHRARLEARDPQAFAAFRERERVRLRAYNKLRRDYARNVSFAIDREDIAVLKKQAASRGVSLAELVRTYVTWGLEGDTA